MAVAGHENTTVTGGRPGVARMVATACLIAAISLVFSLTFAALVFTGPLAPYRDLAVSMAFFSGIVYGVFSIYAGSIPGVWWGNQTAPIVLLAIGVGAVSSELSSAGASAQTLVSTAVVFVAVSTALSGLVMLAIGSFKLAQIAKFIPFPVIAGFLATTGFYLVIRTVLFMATGEDKFMALLQTGQIERWLPYIAAGFAVSLLAKKIGATVALFSTLILYVIGFYLFVFLSGTGLEVAGERGWLLTGGDAASATRIVFAVSFWENADLAIIADQGWTIAALIFLTVLSLVLNITGLELETGRHFNLDRDMRAAGLANLAASIGGGFPGFHSVSMFQLSRHLARDPVPAIAVLAAALLTLALVLGTGLFELLPKGLFAITLSFLGFEFLLQWLVRTRVSMPGKDYSIVIAIVVTAVVFDFVAAILLGLLLAVVMFTLAYARIDVVRSVITARLRLSSVERPSEDIAILQAHGDETLIVELQGYLFFGTAHRILDKVSEAIGVGRHELRHMLVDFRRVNGMDVSTSFTLSRLADLAGRNDITIRFTGLTEGKRRLLAAQLRLEQLENIESLEDALRRIENSVLERERGGASDTSISEFAALLKEAQARSLPLIAEQLDLGAGEHLFTQGEEGDSLAFLQSGRLSAWVGGKDKPAARVASFLAGAVVGEIAFSANKIRTATVSADVESVVLTITQTSLAAVCERDPAFGARFHAILARLLAERLGRTTALLFAIDS